MSARRRATRIAAYAGGGLGTAVITGAAGLSAVLWGEVKLAERRIPIATDPPPPSDDTVWAAAGVSRTRPPIRLAVLGDSLAAGYGAYRDRDTPGAQVAIAISEAARRPVHLRSVAVVGAESDQVAPQLSALGRYRPDLAIVIIGANDVTGRVQPKKAARSLEDIVVALRSIGAEVVVGTCPDLGTVRPLAQPLRAYARHASRKIAKQQTVAVVRAEGRAVSLGDLLGPLFMSNPHYFAEDRFHPSSAGYVEAANALVPSCLDALGLRTRARSASTFTTRRVKSAKKAAAQSVAHPGTEVAAAERFGRREGWFYRRRPLAQLRRRRAQQPPVTSPETAVPVATQPSN